MGSRVSTRFFYERVKKVRFFGKNCFLRLSNEVEDKQKIIFSEKTLSILLNVKLF